ncbi:MAG: hypothetical protein U1E76_09345 [Planctomycetota bacterium]
MAILCARCGRQFDVTLFEFGRAVTCECGALVRGDRAHFGFAGEPEGVRARRLELRHAADRVCELILADGVPSIDVILAAGATRCLARELFPGEAGWFERIYGSRFRRLWQQFRDAPLPPTL